MLSLHNCLSEKIEVTIVRFHNPIILAVQFENFSEIFEQENNAKEK
jgi:hypothetical protein